MDTRRAGQETEEPMEIKMYDVEDVERMARRRREEAEVCSVAIQPAHHFLAPGISKD